MRICSNCQCPVPDEAVFCGNCGLKIQNDAAVTEASPVQAAESTPGTIAPENPASSAQLNSIPQNAETLKTNNVNYWVLYGIAALVWVILTVASLLIN